MQAPHPSLNLLLGWSWILLGFLSGMVMGLFFHREGWLGGYTSLRRRMYRLGHISFFGLGVLNVLFHVTTRNIGAASPALSVASWAFAIGAVTMPLCCGIMAHWPRTYLLFSAPVLSLITGGVLTLFNLEGVGTVPINSADTHALSARHEPRPTDIKLSPQPSTDWVGPARNPNRNPNRNLTRNRNRSRSRNLNPIHGFEITITSRITSRSRPITPT